MFNNEVTYHDKWNTPENEAALRELDNKYFDNSSGCPDCPLAWAPEVLEMMNTIQKELGFKYNEGTIRGYYIQGNPFEWFITNPWRDAWYTFNKNVLHKPYREKSYKKRVAEIFSAFNRSIKYGKTAMSVRYLNPYLNKIFKPKVSLGQLKEKYGSLTVYFNAPDIFDDWIELQIRKCEVKLALKGAYYPIESLWDSSRTYRVNYKYHPDNVSVKYGEYNGETHTDITTTTHRKAMQELGLDLQEIEAKSKASKENDGKAR